MRTSFCWNWGSIWFLVLNTKLLYCVSELRKTMQWYLQVRCVYYPGLPSHPEHDIAKKQMTGFGGVVSFEVGVLTLLELNVLMAWQCICNCYITFSSTFPLWCCRLMETCSSPQNLWMHWKFLILPLLLEAARALWISQPLCLTGM